jgi:osmotically inducible protein OsmC
MERKASAIWQGHLRDGKGALSTASGALSSAPYSFSARFEQGAGTNPEELLAAAHAGCFTMALTAQLDGAKLAPEWIETNATVTLEKLDGSFAITLVHLDVAGRVPDATDEAFQSAAATAKSNCPVSRLFNTKITMSAHLES